MSTAKRHQLIQDILEHIGSLSRLGGHHTHPGHWPKDMPSRAQMGVMFVLLNHKAQGIKELAAQFDISSSAATQLVNGMVEEGLLVRTESKEDRRSVQIDLTPKGKKKLAAAKEARTKMMAAMFEQLSEHELEQFLKLQQKMSDHFQKTCLKK
jgi:DNA-binding MarR family transcriptional regulator